MRQVSRQARPGFSCYRTTANAPVGWASEKREWTKKSEIIIDSFAEYTSERVLCRGAREDGNERNERRMKKHAKDCGRNSDWGKAGAYKNCYSSRRWKCQSIRVSCFLFFTYRTLFPIRLARCGFQTRLEVRIRRVTVVSAAGLGDRDII
jgi:hypothetical protein